MNFIAIVLFNLISLRYTLNMQLEVVDFSIKLDDKVILNDVNFSVSSGETVVIDGKNGSGKSSLVKAISGFNNYQVNGKILLNNADISSKTICERAKLGMFLSYQEPVDISGLSYAEMLQASLSTSGVKLNRNDLQLAIAKGLENLELSPFMAQRHIGCDLSGGEKKKMEVLQILVLKPKLIFLDELDSGLDPKSASLVSKILSDYQKETNASLVVITHNDRILESLEISKRYQIKNRSLVLSENR